MGWSALEAHLVLESRATASDDGDAKDAPRESFLGEHGADALGGGRRQFDDAFVAHAVGGRLGFGSGLVSNHQVKDHYLDAELAGVKWLCGVPAGEGEYRSGPGEAELRGA